MRYHWPDEMRGSSWASNIRAPATSAEVPASVALRLLDHAEAPDIRLTLVKGADHRFSSPECLALIRQTLADVG